jgi:CRISPR-associated protein Cst1
MNDDTIRLTLGDWQWNASLIGFINIVGRENFRFIEADTVEIAAEVLDGFEEKYFDYLIRTYEKTLSWHKIVGFKDRLYAYEESSFESFDLKAIQGLNTYLKDVKRYIKSNSYKAAYELIGLDVDMLSLEKQLAIIKEPKNQQQFDVDKNRIITEAKQIFTILWQIIAYCDSARGKRYIGAKNVIYSVIKYAWNGVSFLNAQTKEKDVYIDYRTYFVDALTDYLKSGKSKYKYHCFVCDTPIKDVKNDLSFLNATGFDVAKKSSHVWDFKNDVIICPMCKLIYSCLPAGMAYVYDRGIYVNANIDMRDALDINSRIKKDVLQGGENRSVYYALVNALHEKENKAAKHEFVDVQVIRYENAKYRFNILSRNMLKIIMDHEENLNSLIKTGFIENGTSVNVFDEVITRIFNSQNLFTLIHRMLHYKLSNPSKCYFNGTHVKRLLAINRHIYQSLGGMKMNTNTDLVKNARAAGDYLRMDYVNKGSDNKLPGICYRLLNALKTSNTDMFMDVVLNCYLYVRDQVPKVITDVLGQEKNFSTMGYAFVSGLIDEKRGKENEK